MSRKDDYRPKPAMRLTVLADMRLTVAGGLAIITAEGRGIAGGREAGVLRESILVSRGSGQLQLPVGGAASGGQASRHFSSMRVGLWPVKNRSPHKL